MKILIFIEHDIMIRHFINSRVFVDLIKKHDVKFIFPEPESTRISCNINTLELGTAYRHLPIHQKRQETWGKLAVTDDLRWRPGRQFRAIRKLRRATNGLKGTITYSTLALPVIYQCFKWWAMQQIEKTPNTQLEDLLNEEKPDLILHPTVLAGVYINDLVDTTHKRGIPLALIMNSWDNPSSKKAMTGTPDWLLVWGEQTKRHAMEFMGMPEDKIVEFGAAQFDVYRGTPRLSREEFCKQYDIDPSVRILLYAGSSKETDEFQHLVEIDDAISNGKLGNTVTIYRPHPWGGGGQGGDRFLDHAWKNIRIEESMRAYLEQIRNGDTSMNLADYRHTHDVLSSIDALVSPLSTIIIEGALHGKPTLCFLPHEDKKASHFQMAAPLIHFDEMYQMPEFLVARGDEQLMPMLVQLLARTEDSESLDRLDQACEFFVRKFDKPYGERLVEFTESILQK